MLCMCTYNVHSFYDGSGKPSFDKIVEVIDEIKPDVLCLQEVHGFSLNKLRSALNLSKVISELLITSRVSLSSGSSEQLRDSTLMLSTIALGRHFLQTPPNTRISSGCWGQKLENFNRLRHPLRQWLMVSGLTTTMHLLHTETYSTKK